MARKTPIAPKHMQRRTVEIRAEDIEKGISGYASHFNSIDSYGTAVKKGAFAKTIAERGSRIPVLWNHWADTPIGKPTELREDETGLYFNASIVEETEKGAEIMALLRSQVPLGMSFGFETLKSRPVEESDTLDWSAAPDYFRSEQGRKEARVIEEVRLWEISVVTFPANEKAGINSVRATEQVAALVQLLEDLRSGELSESDSRHELLQQIVAALPDQPGPVEDATPLLTPARHRDLDMLADLALADARLKGLIEWSNINA